MKRLFLLAVTIATLSAASAADTLTVRIEGMHCQRCANKVKNILKKDKGVNTIQFNIERRTATITYDKAKTCTDSIYAHLSTSERYKAFAYNPNEVINREINLRMDDMHCKKCANRIIASLSKMEGIDSLAPHLDQQSFLIRYDANRTCINDIRNILAKVGFTPVNFYKDERVSYAYYLIPETAATPKTIESVLTIDGVNDANVNVKRKSLAVTFLNTKITAVKLLKEIQKEGIKAVLPKPHVCEKEKKI